MLLLTVKYADSLDPRNNFLSIRKTFENRCYASFYYSPEMVLFEYFKLPTNCLSVFNHFVGLACKGLISKRHTTQPVVTCSKLTIETLEQGVKYVQS